jgi:predicted transglutaminase-like cysteine proteinase
MKKQYSHIAVTKIFILFVLLCAFFQAQVLVRAMDMNQIQQTYKKMGGRPQMLSEWQLMLHDANDLPVNDKLKRVNEFFNRHILFLENKEVWGQEDYWATPMETLSKAKGDCKGYVIAKYFALLELNVPVKQLRLIYVKAQIGGAESPIQQAHMILAYYATPDAEPLILDNLITDIRPASRRSDLLPIYSFNSDGIFVGVGGGTTVGPGGVGQLSHWADLLRRAHAEGF